MTSLPGSAGAPQLSALRDSLVMLLVEGTPAPARTQWPSALTTAIDFVLVRGVSPPVQAPAQLLRNSAWTKTRGSGGDDIMAASSATPAAQRAAYGIPVDFVPQNSSVRQMVWGPGTYGFSPVDLALYYKTFGVPLTPDIVSFDTVHHGTPGGDNFEEGSLDVQIITGFAPWLLHTRC
jgi:hypothetical protein